jgi:hypothetical protein
LRSNRSTSCGLITHEIAFNCTSGLKLNAACHTLYALSGKPQAAEIDISWMIPASFSRRGFRRTAT